MVSFGDEVVELAHGPTPAASAAAACPDGAAAAGGVFFEDFPEHRVVESASITVTEAHVVGWATLTGDWYPLHMDEEWAREHGLFGARVVHGPFIFALVVGLLERTNVFGESILAWLGVDELRATAPTFIGDTIRARATVLERRLSRSERGRGIVILLYEALNQRDEAVLSCKCAQMMRTRPVG